MRDAFQRSNIWCVRDAKLRKDACSFLLRSSEQSLRCIFVGHQLHVSCCIASTLAIAFKRDGPAGAAVPLTDLIHGTNGADVAANFLSPLVQQVGPTCRHQFLLLHKRTVQKRPLKRSVRADVDRKSTNAIFSFFYKFLFLTHASFGVKNLELYTALNTE